VGLVSEDVFAGGPAYRSCELNKQAAAGVSLMRQTFDWSSIERSRGNYDFSYHDAYVAALAQHRIRVLPVLFNPPRFRSSRPRRGGRRGTYPPRRLSSMGRFGAAVVRRYGRRGSFWRSRPDLPKVPVRALQIWNEPHIRVYWPRGPSPRQYTRLLRAAERGIKRADRRVEVVTAALSQTDIGVPLRRFVAGMYRAGARSAFDTLAVNPYGQSPGRALGVVRGLRRLMNSRGDRRGRLWVTEFGWATGGRSRKYRVSERRQGRWVPRLLRLLHRNRRRLRLRGAIYYNWKDSAPYPPLFQDFFGLHTGLLRRDSSAKPAYFGFDRVARRIR
jgi:polysaccharide biosynthesis protein PslG